MEFNFSLKHIFTTGAWFSGSRLKVERLNLSAKRSLPINHHLFTLVAFLVTLLTACLPDTPEPLPSRPPRTTAEAMPGFTETVADGTVRSTWHVVFILSGGFEGLSKSLELHSDGTMKATNERLEQQAGMILEPEEVTQIGWLLQEVCPLEEFGRPPSCADCFLYNLEIQFDEMQCHVLLNDISLPSSGLETLVSKLSTILNRTLDGN